MYLDPETARNVDTAFFCAIRKLFDNINDDGYEAADPAFNRNCTFVWMNDLVRNENRLFASYDFLDDTVEQKWVDNSGNRLHGWALLGTSISRSLIRNDGTEATRVFSRGSVVNFPVPVNHDARVYTSAMSFKLDQAVNQTAGIVILKHTIDNGNEVILSVVKKYKDTRLRYQWTGSVPLDLESSSTISVSDGEFHQWTIMCDRRNSDLIRVNIDEVV